MVLKPIIAAACAAGLALSASSASAAPSARTVELAKRYMAAMHMENTMGAMMANMAPAMLDGIAKQAGGEVPSDVRIAFTAAAEEATRAMTPKMMEAMMPAVAETFTEAELEAAVAYYESAPGQALMGKMPAFTAKVSPALVQMQPAIQAEIVGRFCKKVGCDPATLK